MQMTMIEALNSALALEMERDTRVVVLGQDIGANGGVFRSEDKGETWTKMSETNPRGAYYSQIRIDPNNDQRIWVLGAPMYFSEDGGKTFKSNLIQRVHGELEAMRRDESCGGERRGGGHGREGNRPPCARCARRRPCVVQSPSASSGRR